MIFVLLWWAAQETVDEIVGKYVREGGPGAAVLVVHEGKAVHKKGYGLANLELGVPITADTVFDLASVSKQFTATAVMMLAGRGKLNLDDDVRVHVPQLPEQAKDRPIRVRDLLHHTSGLPDYLGFDLPKKEAEVTNDDIVKLLADRALEFPTGTKFAYSNSNYLLLGMIIERVSGKSYREFVTAEIFEPLGMKASTVYDDSRRVIKNRAYGYQRSKEGWKGSHSDLTTTGDGGVMTPIEDWVRWEEALRGDALVAGEKLFVASELDGGKPNRYGFGWMIGKVHGRRAADHTGGWMGISTYVVRFLDEPLAVVVLSNDQGFPSMAVGRKVARLYLK